MTFQNGLILNLTEFCGELLHFGESLNQLQSFTRELSLFHYAIC